MYLMNIKGQLLPMTNLESSLSGSWSIYSHCYLQSTNGEKQKIFGSMFTPILYTLPQNEWCTVCCDLC
jgi:hypothetical protein